MTIHTDQTIAIAGIADDLTTSTPDELYTMIDTLIQSRQARNWDRSEQSYHHRDYCDDEIAVVKSELERRGLRVTRPEPFDYDALDAETRIVVMQRTTEIRERMRLTAQTVLGIGAKLIEVKERLGHGYFGTWLEAEFGWTERTAQRFMSVAGRFKSVAVSDLNFAPSALYLLAAPSTPEPVRKEALARAQSGERITPSTARTIVEAHKPSQPRPAVVVGGESSTPGDPTPEPPRVTVYRAGPAQPDARVASVRERIAEAIRGTPIERQRDAGFILTRYARSHPDDKFEVVLGLVACGEFKTVQSAILASLKRRERPEGDAAAGGQPEGRQDVELPPSPERTPGRRAQVVSRRIAIEVAFDDVFADDVAVQAAIERSKTIARQSIDCLGHGIVIDLDSADAVGEETVVVEFVF